MSIDLPVEDLPDPGRERRALWTRDLRTARVLRFAFGATAVTAIAFALAWPLYFVTPILVVVSLGMPLPAPTLGQGWNNILYVFVAFVLGLVFALLLLPYPLVFAPVLALVLFHIYYLANRGGPFFLVLMSLIAVFILPLLVDTNEAIGTAFGMGFIGSGVLAILTVWVAHAVFPDPPSDQPRPTRPGFQPGYSAPAAENAMKSTIAIFPLALLFVYAGWSSQALVLAFAGIFSLSPILSRGRAAATASLKSTLIGGLVSVGFYYLIIAAPELPVFIALALVVFLAFGAGIFSTHPLAPYLGSAAVAFVVLLGGVMGEDASITDKFFTRVFLVMLAALYIVAALSLLERYWPGKNDTTASAA
ncbi:MAG: DUF2955 domain-containing protein [Pseudomonadota bacterium]|nr:DUF2955 domain-containing protein [Pseudomonadota bacterium]